jgi:hypothetical protein
MYIKEINVAIKMNNLVLNKLRENLNSILIRNNICQNFLNLWPNFRLSKLPFSENQWTNVKIRGGQNPEAQPKPLKTVAQNRTGSVF